MDSNIYTFANKQYRFEITITVLLMRMPEVSQPRFTRRKITRKSENEINEVRELNFVYAEPSGGV